MDIYAIICMFTLVVQCLWHAIICAIIFLYTPDFRLTRYMWFAKLDQLVFFIVIGIFVVLHVVVITWWYMVPYRHRKNMDNKDAEYKQLLSGKKKGKSSEALAETKGNPPGFSRIPLEEDEQL
jgi:type VI protein secretion system component VasK